MSYNLLDSVEYGGCSAKLPAQALEDLLNDIHFLSSDQLIVGPDTHDDASVWKINDETAIITTTDFFPPVCSDAYEFGQIAASNSLSDIYAMGGSAITALNLVMFPSSTVSIEVLKDIMRGGADKAAEAGCVLSGGHTIDDPIPKYGLAVTGTVHPDKIITNSNAEVGDILILTKAIGTAVILSGHRIGETTDANLQIALDSMKQLNKDAAEVMQQFGIKCATDITGFSLLGHSMRIGQASAKTLKFNAKDVPLFPSSYELVELGCIPGASFNNLSFIEKNVHFSEDLDYNLKMLMVDAQTSGGILLCCPHAKVEEVLKALSTNHSAVSVVGEVQELIDTEIFVSV